MRTLRSLALLCFCAAAAFSSASSNAQSLSVMPAVSASDVNASLPVAVVVSGLGPAATGTVILTGGGYSSGAQILDHNGDYLFNIPANSLSIGTETLTVNYSGDTNYPALTKSAIVKVGVSAPLKMSVIGPIASQVAAGAGHTCVLTSQSITQLETIRCWGSNNHGQLGNGTLTDTTVPVEVDSKFYTSTFFNDLEVIALAIGDNHTCALLPDSGQPVCWGANASGQLGNGSNADSSTPVMTTGIKMYNKVAALAAGSAHTCALLEDGTAQCWGGNAHGQLGDGSFANSSLPVTVSGLTNAIAIAAGGDHTCALLSGGSVVCWGENGNGQLGNNSITDSSTPVVVGGLSGSVTLLALGGTHTCALVTDGTMNCWGGNAHGQLGNGSIIDSSKPVAVSGIVGATTLAAGRDHTCTVVAAGGGTVECWGSNAVGQLGDNSITDRTTPVHTGSLAGVTALTLGGSHTCAQNEVGVLACWGDNSTGQLGNGTKQAGGILSPLPVNGMGGSPDKLSTGDLHACSLTSGGTANLGSGGALKTNGALFCWGVSNGGELGDGLNEDSATPVEVAGLANTVREIFTGDGATCAVLTDDSVDCWGYTNSVKSTTPVKITGFSGNVLQLSISPFTICALISNGTVQCWGNNYYGGLGDGTNNNSTTPVTVVGLSGATALTGRNYHFCALVSGGTAECWGDGVSTISPVTGLSSAKAISAGEDFNCALLSDSTVECWGLNAFGQLGNGKTSSNPTGVGAVVGLSGVTLLSAGGAHVCVLLSDTTVQCWGNSTFGQLGNGTTTNSSVPVKVNGLTGVTAISSGVETTLAVVSDGTLQGWGTNDAQQLGDSIGMDSLNLEQSIYVFPVPAFEGQSIEFNPPQSVAVGTTVDLAPLVTGSSDLKATFDTWTSDTCSLLYPAGGSALTVLSSYGSLLCGVRAAQVGGYNLHGGSLAPASSHARSVAVGASVLTPNAAFSPTGLAFGSVDVGVTSAAQTLTLSNSGGAPLNISGISITGASASVFKQTNSCGLTLAAGASCTVSVTFAPASPAGASASISVADNAPGSPQTAALSGIGTAPGAPKAALTPAVQDFGSVTVGASSASQTFTLTNAGTAALPITSAGISGPNAASFNIASNTCGASLAAGANCNITATFTPSAAGLLSASLTVSDSLGAQTASITGTGAAPAPKAALTPAVQDFGSFTLGSSGAVQTFTLTNAGTATLPITSTGISGPSAASFNISSNTCGASLAAGANCKIAVTFKPSAAGAASASLNVYDSLGTQTASMTGTGVAPAPAFTITPSTLNFGNVGLGEQKTINITLTNVSNTPVQFVSITPFDSAFSNLPPFFEACDKIIPVGGSCTGPINFNPSVLKSYSGTITLKGIAATCAGCTASYPDQAIAVTGTGVAPAPAFTITPSTLNFGSVIVEQPTQLFLTLKNVSSTQVFLKSLTSSDPAIDVSAAFEPCVFMIDPGGTCSVPVSFTPAAAKNYSATITLATGCIGTCSISYSNQTIAVTGTGVAPAPAISITPSPLNFGNVVVGQTKSLLVTLTNVAGPGVAPQTFTASDPTINLSGLAKCNIAFSYGASCSGLVSFTPTAAKNYAATITVGNFIVTCLGCAIVYPNQTIAVTGMGTPLPPTLTPSLLDFSNTTLGTDSPTQSFTVKNPRTTPVFISESLGGANPDSFVAPSGFHLTEIAPGATITLGFFFTPKIVGPSSATLYIAFSDTLGDPAQTITAILVGTGVAPPPPLPPMLTPSLQDFGSTTLGTSSPTKTFLFKNPRSIPVFISESLGGTNPDSFVAPLGFHLTEIAPGATIALDFLFTPKSVGPSSATLYIAYWDTLGGPQQTITAILVGIGIAPPPPLPPTLTPSSLAFSPTTLATDSPTQSFTFKNPRTTPVFISETLGGANPDSFVAPSGFHLTEVAPGATVTLGFFFMPKSVGPASASLSIAYSSTVGGPQQTITAILVGTGIAPPPPLPPTLTPSTLDFGPTLLGTDSPTKSFTFKNPRSSPLFISETLGGTNPGNFGSLSSFSLTEVAPGASITFPFFFVPVTAGPYSATLFVVYSDVLGGPSQTITASLTGTGIAPPPPILTPSLQDFGNTALGTDSPIKSIIVKNPRSTAVFISESLGGANPDSFVAPSGFHLTEIAPGASIPFSFYFKPKSAGSALATLYIAYSSTLGGPQQTITAILAGIGIGTGAAPAPPTFSPPGGVFASKQIVTLSDATPGSTIHLTVDGSTPTAFSTVYASPIEIDSTETVRAIAVLGGVSSAVSSASYTINLTACHTVNYSSGFTASGLSLNGGAFINGSALELTDGGPSEARSAFFSTTLPTTTFTTDFTFQITDPLADGFTFVVQSSSPTALGTGGGGLGYAGIPHSAAIKVDLYNNAGEGVDSTGTYVNGAYPATPSVNLTGSGIDFHSGHIFAGHLAYTSGVTLGTIKDTVTGVSASMNFPGDITAIVGTSAWFGFTAGTGGAGATQKILTWSYTGGAGCPAK